MTYKIVTDREMALERENARLVDKTERQSATIHVQAVAIQAMQAEIAASERNLEQLTDELAQSRKAQPVQEPELLDGDKPLWMLYEELRQATDGGSESMTHKDALGQIAYWREQCSLIHNSAKPAAAQIRVTMATDTGWSEWREIDLKDVDRKYREGVETRKLYAAPTQPVQEPVAQYCGTFLTPQGTREFFGVLLPGKEIEPSALLYANPVAQPVQSPSLTDEQIRALLPVKTGSWFDFARAIEAAIKGAN